MKFLDLKLEVKIPEIGFKFGENEIKVKQYLPIEQKASIVNIATRGAVVDGIVSRVLMDAYLHLLIVENYSDLEFSDEDKDDLLGTFDKLQSTGLVDLVIENLPQAEYEYLFNETNIHADNLNKFYASFGLATQSMQNLGDIFNPENIGQKE
jgi:hypothetical protein